MIDDECIQTIINKYFKQVNILTNHQIESYNNYIDVILPSIISQFFPIYLSFNDKNMNVKSISVNLTNINIEQPYYTENNGCSKIMTPYIARLRNLTYSLTVLVNVEISIVIMKDNNYENLPVKIIENIILAKIPIVVKSKYCTYKKDISNECSLDPGGYYIINGNEKVLITQEKITPNIIQVYAISKNASKYSIVSEIRS